MHDVVILGTGIAGCTAAIYTARANLNPLVISGPEDGGQLTLTTDVENYPGFPEGVQGPELVQKCKQQAERFGTRFELEIVTNFETVKGGYQLILSSGKKINTKTLIISTGASAKWLNLESEEKYKGRGVTTCATCLPTGSNIVANNSPKPINEISEGEKVLSHDGTFQKVIGKGSRKYNGELIKIIPRYLREEPTLLTPEHPVLVTTMVRGTGQNYWNINWGNNLWVAAGELGKNHILLYPIVKKIKDVSHIKLSNCLNVKIDDQGYVHYKTERHTSRKVPNLLPLNGNFMRLIGYFLSEGSITKGGVNLYFGLKDKQYVADAAEIIKEIFDYDVRIKQADSVLRIECYAGIIRDFFEKMFGKYSYGKSLPHWFIYLPYAKQVELMRGYYRGDGGMKPKAFSLITNSPKLVAQFKTILLRLGVIPGITKRQVKDLNRTKNILNGREIKFKHDKYEFDIGGSWMKRAGEIFGVDHPYLSKKTRSHQFAWIRGNYVFLPIKILETQVYEGEVHNITVENNNSYVTSCATVHNCDGAFFKDKEVAVIGGGDSAMEESLFLTKFATKVTIIHRRDVFKASKIMQERVLKHNKIKVIWNSEVVEILGDGKKVSGIKLRNINQKITEFKCEGIFLAIGHVPNTAIFRGKLDLDEKGYVKTDRFTHTNLPGVFAAGDVQDVRYRQAITAAGSGCQTAIEVEKYLAEKEL